LNPEAESKTLIHEVGRNTAKKVSRESSLTFLAVGSAGTTFYAIPDLGRPFLGTALLGEKEMRQGKTLEILIQKINKCKFPNAIVKSPDYIPDCDTGELREVDVSVKFNDSGHFFVFECRDRSAIQDTTWIEQLISKRRSVNADVLIAVTSSDFFEATKIKAHKNGILIRKLEEIKKDELLALDKIVYIELHLFLPKFISDFYLMLDGSNKPHKLQYPLSQYKFFDKLNNQILDLHSIIKLVIRDLGKKVPNNKDIIAQDVSCKNNYLFIDLPPQYKVNETIFSLQIEKVVRIYPIFSAQSYDDYEKVISKVYNFGLQNQIVSQVITNEEKNVSSWEINVSNLEIPEGYIFDCIKYIGHNVLTERN
jgi:hypothetical protein